MLGHAAHPGLATNLVGAPAAECPSARFRLSPGSGFVPHKQPRNVPQEDLAGLAVGLQARSKIDVPAQHDVLRATSRSEVADRGLAGLTHQCAKSSPPASIALETEPDRRRIVDLDVLLAKLDCGSHGIEETSIRTSAKARTGGKYSKAEITHRTSGSKHHEESGRSIWRTDSKLKFIGGLSRPRHPSVTRRYVDLGATVAYTDPLRGHLGISEASRHDQNPID